MGDKEVDLTRKDPPDGDPDGGKERKDDEEMLDEKSDQKDERYNHNIRISIKEKRGEATKYLKMMYQLLRECLKHDKTTMMSDHGGQKFTIDQFPLKEDNFKKAFDGGPQEENGYKTPESYPNTLPLS